MFFRSEDIAILRLNLENLLLGLIFLGFFYLDTLMGFFASTRLLVGGAYFTLADFFGGDLLNF